MDLTNPQSFNRYAYVLNNPTAFLDPLGLACSPGDTSSSGCPIGYTPDGVPIYQANGSSSSSSGPTSSDLTGLGAYGPSNSGPNDGPPNLIYLGGSHPRGGSGGQTAPTANNGGSGGQTAPAANSGGSGGQTAPTPNNGKPQDNDYCSVLDPSCHQTPKQKLVSFACKGSADQRILSSMKTGFLLGAVRGGFAGAAGGAFFEGVGAIPGAVLGGFVGGVAGAGGGVLKGGAIAGTCSLAGVY